MDFRSKAHTLGAVIQGLYEFYEPEHYCLNADDAFRPCNCASIGVERRKEFDMIEQFALAFVMEELYNKRWDGTKWEK